MKKVNIELKMFMTFREYLPPESVNGKSAMSLDEGSTLEDIMHILGIPMDKTRIVVINGISHGVDTNTTLEEGDIVSFFAPVGGG